MARPYIMIKKIEGIEYAYFYRNIRASSRKGKFKAVMVRYIGRLDLLIDALNSVLGKRGREQVLVRRTSSSQIIGGKRSKKQV
jgi:hypothetical protein